MLGFVFDVKKAFFCHGFIGLMNKMRRLCIDQKWLTLMEIYGSRSWDKSDIDDLGWLGPRPADLA